MFTRVWLRLVHVAVSIGFLGAGAFPVAAQSTSGPPGSVIVVPPDPVNQQPAVEPAAKDGGQHDMHNMSHQHSGEGDAANREGSGTAWQPDETPMYAIHGQGKG